MPKSRFYSRLIVGILGFFKSVYPIGYAGDGCYTLNLPEIGGRGKFILLLIYANNAL